MRCVVRLFAVVVLLSLIGLAGPVLAQTDTGRIQGTVTDPQGAIVAGATVTVTNLGSSRSVSAQTNTEGVYVVSALPPGRYRIEVKQSGFKAVSQEITLEVTQVAAVNFSLVVGAVTETVTVTEEAGLVDPATSSVGEVVVGRQVTELPLNGRNFTQLATLVPGVTRGVPDGQASGAQGNAETFRYGNAGGAALSVNGLREQANNFILDGIDNNESLVNTIIFFPPAEAIQEFRVQTSVAPAEFGRAGGALVVTTTKSGTNDWHGSAFWFLRNDNLDARKTFDAKKSEFRRHQFGGTVGGAIFKDKLFVFGNYQGLRQYLPFERELATVPTAAMLNGDFSILLNPALSGYPSAIFIRDPLLGLPCNATNLTGCFPGNIIPTNRLNQVARNYLTAFPDPNNGTQAFKNYAAIRTQIQNFDDYDIRVDWNMSQKDFVFGRWSHGNDDSTTSSRLPTLPSGFGSGTNFNNPRSVVLGYTRIFSQTIISEMRFGFVRTKYGYIPPFQDQTISADLGIPNANTSPLLGGGALIGGYNNQLEYTGDFGPFLVPQNTFHFTDTVSLFKGNHSLRFGGSMIRRQVNLFRPNRGKGYFFLFGDGGGNSPTQFEITDLLAGFVDEYTVGPPFGMVGTRSWELGYYFQDDWRITPKLTLNLGVRYDLYTWPTEVADRQANFDPFRNILVIAGTPGAGHSLIPADKNNWAPRIGFAYDIFGRGKTILRGGYGLFYFLDRGGIDNQLAQNPPFSGYSSFTYNSGVRIALSGRAPNNSSNNALATGALPLGTLTNLDPLNPANVTVFAALQTNVISSVQQWSLQVQQQLTKDSSLSVGYLGTRSNDLTTYYDSNRQLFNRPSGTKLFPLLGGVNVQESRGKSIYHSLQIQHERRMAKGWQYLLSYTFARNIDDSKGAYGGRQPQDFQNFRLERGLSDLDVRYRLVFSSIYELPFGRGRTYGSDWNAATDAVLGGWQINGILTFQSGLPFDLSASGGSPGDVRPDVVGSVSINADSTSQYFTTSAFANPPIGPGGVYVRPGNAGRNILVGPGTKVMDFSIFKDFRVYENWRLQFRTEFYNLTNTPQFSQPDGNLGSGNFGKITGTRQGTNRQIQIALRLSF